MVKTLVTSQSLKHDSQYVVVTKSKKTLNLDKDLFGA